MGPHAGAVVTGEEEGAAEMKGYQLTTTPIPHPHVSLGELGGGGRVRS